MDLWFNQSPKKMKKLVEIIADLIARWTTTTG
jgi:hypothetical protein